MERDFPILTIVNVITNVATNNNSIWFVQMANFWIKHRINADQVNLSIVDLVEESILSGEIHVVVNAMEHLSLILIIVDHILNVVLVRATAETVNLDIFSMHNLRDVLKLIEFNVEQELFLAKTLSKMLKISFPNVLIKELISAEIHRIAQVTSFVMKAVWSNNIASQVCITILANLCVTGLRMRTVCRPESSYLKLQFFLNAPMKTDISQILQIVNSTTNAWTMNRNWKDVLLEKCGTIHKNDVDKWIRKCVENLSFDDLFFYSGKWNS